MRVVVALGGNALLRRGEPPEASTQRQHLRLAAQAIAHLASEHEVLVVHGNGPQVGLLAAENENDPALRHPYPLGDLVAESQGLIGSWIQQALLDEHCPAVAIVTQVVVDGEDSAFDSPSKPIGVAYDESTARSLAAQRGWTVAADGESWRRTVASPRPLDVLNLAAAARLVEGGFVVVLGGGGGVPLRRCHPHPLAGRGEGLEPIDAVVDKDLVASMIADRLDAELLLVLTDVTGVMSGYGTPDQRLIRRASPTDLDRMAFAAGSMGPKVAACSEFVRGGRFRRAAVGSLDALQAIVEGRAGTQIAMPHVHGLFAHSA